MKKKVKDTYSIIRHILGNEVVKNNRTGFEYLVEWPKMGKPVFRRLKK
jgi:hypothetical protein